MSSELATMIARMTERLRTFAMDVKHFTALGEQVVPDIAIGAPGKVRWWRWNGAPYRKDSWELLRTADGVWMAWPVGKVAHPPFFAQIYPKSPKEIIEAIDGFGGFVLPVGLPHATTFEQALCAPAKERA